MNKRKGEISSFLGGKRVRERERGGEREMDREGEREREREGEREREKRKRERYNVEK